jgi:tRNA A-37 threonylcarbamoyl transferase component Bud32
MSAIWSSLSNGPNVVSAISTAGDRAGLPDQVIEFMKPWPDLSGDAFSAIAWICAGSEREYLQRILSAPARIIKVSEAKKVTCHSLDGQDYFVKRYRYPGLLRPLEYLHRKSQARREWELWQRLQQSGLPIVRHIAAGERRSGRLLHEAVLVTEGFPGVPLNEAGIVCWSSVLALIRRMHDCGVLHRDLHPANILVQPETGELCLVDLKGIVLKKRISRAEREINLALLRIAVPIPVADNVLQLSKSIRQRAYYRRSYRCLKRNREFDTITLNGLRWNVRLPFLNSQVRTLLEDPLTIRLADTTTLERGRSNSVMAYGEIVIKRFHHRRLLSRFGEMASCSRARRAYRKAYHLELLGIPTPHPIATATQRSLRNFSRSYLITGRVDQARELHRYLGETRHPDAAVIRHLAQMIAGLHEEGFSHSDLNTSNILVDAGGQCWLINLDALRFVRCVSDARAAADLRRLQRAVRLEPREYRRAAFIFLKQYLRLRGRISWTRVRGEGGRHAGQ